MNWYGSTKCFTRCKASIKDEVFIMQIKIVLMNYIILAVTRVTHGFVYKVNFIWASVVIERLTRVETRKTKTIFCLLKLYHYDPFLKGLTRVTHGSMCKLNCIWASVVIKTLTRVEMRKIKTTFCLWTRNESCIPFDTGYGQIASIRRPRCMRML